MTARPGSIYTRLETDVEFRARLSKATRHIYDATSSGYFCGEALDDWGWTHCRLQRRIVEDESK